MVRCTGFRRINQRVSRGNKMIWKENWIEDGSYSATLETPLGTFYIEWTIDSPYEVWVEDEFLWAWDTFRLAEESVGKYLSHKVNELLRTLGEIIPYKE